jgi:hypothetical protein
MVTYVVEKGVIINQRLLLVLLYFLPIYGSLNFVCCQNTRSSRDLENNAPFSLLGLSSPHELVLFISDLIFVLPLGFGCLADSLKRAATVLVRELHGCYRCAHPLSFLCRFRQLHMQIASISQINIARELLCCDMMLGTLFSSDVTRIHLAQNRLK